MRPARQTERQPIVVGFTSFFAGAAVASLCPWPPLPKAVLIISVTALVTMLMLSLHRPQRAPQKPGKETPKGDPWLED
jgi:hypothetical protein